MKAVCVRAPSNIAWIKYMGKKPNSKNIPENASLSMTLESLCSVVSLTEEDSSRGESLGERTRWNSSPPILPAHFPNELKLGRLDVPALDSEGQTRILKHLEKVLTQASAILSAEGIAASTPSKPLKPLTLRSANTFPPASGIASSASSFAAVTLAGLQISAQNPEEFGLAWSRSPSLRQAAARLSREGSGSSCRSMEGPFVLWPSDEDSKDDNTPLLQPHALPPLHHFVLLVSAEKKKVSSSEAHLRVKSSPLWMGRVERTHQRLKELQAALRSGELNTLARVSWQEAWEMHSLFHTSNVPFSYWQPGTIEILQWLSPFVNGGATSQTQSPLVTPIITMDAGPNIHMTVPEGEAQEWRTQIKKQFPNLAILEDKPGTGAQCLPSKP